MQEGDEEDSQSVGSVSGVSVTGVENSVENSVGQGEDDGERDGQPAHSAREIAEAAQLRLMANSSASTGRRRKMSVLEQRTSHVSANLLALHPAPTQVAGLDVEDSTRSRASSANGRPATSSSRASTPSGRGANRSRVDLTDVATAEAISAAAANAGKGKKRGAKTDNGQHGR